MTKYIMRLDDACEKMDIDKWQRMEDLLTKYDIRPLVGVIPDCKDPMMDKYPYDCNFKLKVDRWKEKGWELALHGFNHVYTTEDGGINPVNKRSEFAGEPYDIQKEKIINGLNILYKKNIFPKVFFAPSHTFDLNTIMALKDNSSIRIISDTIARKPYSKYGITFVPQQSGTVRNIYGMITTFCYHPNTMNDEDFTKLEDFLCRKAGLFIDFPVRSESRQLDLVDRILKFLYFLKRKL